MSADIAAFRALLAASSVPPWTPSDSDNVKFIVAMRNELPGVLDEVETYRALGPIAAGPNVMDGAAGPVCGCGAPSVDESGWCGREHLDAEIESLRAWCHPERAREWGREDGKRRRADDGKGGSWPSARIGGKNLGGNVPPKAPPICMLYPDLAAPAAPCFALSMGFGFPMRSVTREILITREAAAYCGLTMSGLRQAYIRGRVRSAGRRGGNGTLTWRRADLDAFLLGQAPAELNDDDDLDQALARHDRREAVRSPGSGAGATAATTSELERLRRLESAILAYDDHRLDAPIDAGRDQWKRWHHKSAVLIRAEDAAIAEARAAHAKETPESPTCTSPQPGLHPAMQCEGEVEICPDPWHGAACWKGGRD